MFFLKLDSLLHNNMSAGKLFQVTGAAYENERLANTVFVLAGQSAVDVQQNVSGGWRRVGQDVLSCRLEHRS